MFRNHIQTAWPTRTAFGDFYHSLGFTKPKLGAGQKPSTLNRIIFLLFYCFYIYLSHFLALYFDINLLVNMTGETVSKPAWGKDQPNNYNGEQNCVVLDGGRNWLWNDIGCNIDYLHFVCQHGMLNGRNK